MNTSSGYYCHGVTEASGLGISFWGFFYARTLRTNDATSAIKGSCREFIIRASSHCKRRHGGGLLRQLEKGLRTSNGNRSKKSRKYKQPANHVDCHSVFEYEDLYKRQ